MINHDKHQESTSSNFRNGYNEKTINSKYGKFDVSIPIDRDSIFEQLIKKDNLKIERIISKGHVTTEFEWYNQDSDEWVIVLKGEAVLSFLNEDDVRLKAGDYLNIPANTKHKVSWTVPDEETVWLAVHY